MRITLGTGPLGLATTTRITRTLCCRSSHFADGEHVSIEEVFDAYYSCRKKKRNTKSALEFEMDYEINCCKLCDELNNMTYEIGESRTFCVSHPKAREIFAANFRDRIVHHLIINKFNENFEKKMIDSSFACRSGKGAMYGSLEVQKIMNELGGDAWYGKCDIQGFFMSLNKEVLLNEIERIINNSDVNDKEWWLWLIEKVVMHRLERKCSMQGDIGLWKKIPKIKSLFFSKGKGLPIGNLTSQVFANVYMSIFDRWVIEKVGENGRYCRYVDDFIVFHKDKDVVKKLIKESRKYLREELDIVLHPKKISIQQVHKGIRFVGFYILRDHIMPSKRLVEGAVKLAKNSKKYTIEKFMERMNSRFGLMVHQSSFRLRKKIWRLICENNDERFIFIDNKKLNKRTKNEELYQNDSTN